MFPLHLRVDSRHSFRSSGPNLKPLSQKVSRISPKHSTVADGSVTPDPGVLKRLWRKRSAGYRCSSRPRPAVPPNKHGGVTTVPAL